MDTERRAKRRRLASDTTQYTETSKAHGSGSSSSSTSAQGNAAGQNSHVVTRKARKKPSEPRATTTSHASTHTKTTATASSSSGSMTSSNHAKNSTSRSSQKRSGVNINQSARNVSQGQAPTEKRLARVRTSCPKNILDRVERVMSQRFFMIDRTREGKELREEFSVLGSTGNVYIVTIGNLPSCSCPDFGRGNHCKHILFVFLKVLQVPLSSSYWYQKALLSSELADIFSKAPLAPNSLAHPRVREAYAHATGKAGSSSSSPEETSQKKRIPGPEDDCPICYESMHEIAENKLWFCEECGNALHGECFKQWAVKCAHDLTCVWCRAKVQPDGSSASSAATVDRDGYINLANVAGISTARDRSTYYQSAGWQRSSGRFYP